MVATADIGLEVARLLVGDWREERTIERGTPVCPDAIARAMGEVVG